VVEPIAKDPREVRFDVPLLAQEASYLAASAKMASFCGKSMETLNDNHPRLKNVQVNVFPILCQPSRFGMRKKASNQTGSGFDRRSRLLNEARGARLMILPPETAAATTLTVRSCALSFQPDKWSFARE
jgi:hypothetical protein